MFGCSGITQRFVCFNATNHLAFVCAANCRYEVLVQNYWMLDVNPAELPLPEEATDDKDLCKVSGGPAV